MVTAFASELLRGQTEKQMLSCRTSCKITPERPRTNSFTWSYLGGDSQILESVSTHTRERERERGKKLSKWNEGRTN